MQKSDSEKISTLKEYLDFGFRVNPVFDFIEHTSANPTGALHIGNLVHGVSADLICKLSKITPYYYVNDCGVNFSKYILKLKDLSEEDLEPIRISLSKSYPLEARIYRDQVILQNLKIYDSLKLTRPKFIYQSEVLSQLDQRLKTVNLKVKDGVIGESRIYTSSGLPLYMAGDLSYKIKIDRLHKKKLMYVGGDHLKYIKDLDLVYHGFDWNYVLGPIVRNEGLKLSKRNNQIITFSELCKIKNLSEDKGRAFFKLFCWKYESRDVLEIRSMIEQNSADLLKLVEVKEVGPVSFQNLNLNSAVLKVWFNINQILESIVLKHQSNRFYKLLERLYYLKQREQNKSCLFIHYHLLSKLLDYIRL